MTRKKKCVPDDFYRAAEFFYLVFKEQFVSYAYVTWEELRRFCEENYDGFSDDLLVRIIRYLQREKKILVQRNRLYTRENYEYEETIAEIMAEAHDWQLFPAVDLPERIVSQGRILSDEQRNAVKMALENKYSMILGGAGTGKTTIIRAIIEQSGLNPFNTIVCAPTGKAARNLESRLHCEAHTIHSVLGVRPDTSFMKKRLWKQAGLVLVDEAGMADIGMTAGLLNHVSQSPGCRLVLIGDTRQLKAVGPGEMLQFFSAIGMPTARLTENRRLVDNGSALVQNITNFDQIASIEDMCFDQHFCVREMTDSEALEAIAADAAERYARGDSLQVLSPRNNSGPLSAVELNLAIQAKLNPSVRGKRAIRWRTSHEIRDGDRVIIIQNDSAHNVSNGDVGVIHFGDVPADVKRMQEFADYTVQVSISLEDGRQPTWWLRENETMRNLDLAYCLTVNKSQGGEADTIILSLSNSMGVLRNRNIFYTGISRARESVIIYGTRAAIATALKNEPPPKQSSLMERYIRHLHQHELSKVASSTN